MIAWSFLSSVSPEGHIFHWFLAVSGPCESACGLIGSIFNLFNLFMNFWASLGVFLSVFLAFLGIPVVILHQFVLCLFCRWYLKIFFYGFAPDLPAVSLVALVPPCLIKPHIFSWPVQYSIHNTNKPSFSDSGVRYAGANQTQGAPGPAFTSATIPAACIFHHVIFLVHCGPAENILGALYLFVYSFSPWGSSNLWAPGVWAETNMLVVRLLRNPTGSH